ncbi:MAG: hypothetical protein ACWGOX_03865, partial [Desulforhopalus sp.]
LVSQLSGDEGGIDFQSLRIDKGESVVEAEDGKINWRDIFGWEGRFLVQNFDPSVLSAQLPGKVSADLVSIGDVRENGVVASFAVAGLNGVLRGQNISASGDIFLNETEVHTDGLTIESDTVEGVANIDRAMFSWSEQPSWEAEVHLRKFNPAVLHEDFYGAVNAVFSGAGLQGDRGVEGYVNIADISGTLRGQKLSGGGNIRFSADGYSTSGLTLKSGRSELQLEGKAGDTLGIDFSFTSPNIGEIAPDSGGWLHVDGGVTESPESPRLNITVAGKGLRYRDITAQDLRATLQAELTKEGTFNASMRGAAIEVPGKLVTNGRVDISGRLQDHEIAVSLDSDALQVKGRAKGGYEDHWQGKISQFRLQSPEIGTWQQQGVTATTIGSSIVLEPFCLANGPGNICVSGMFQAGENRQWKVNGDINGLPLNVLELLQPSLLPIHGRLKGNIRLAGDGTGATFAKISLAVPKISFATDWGDGDMSSFIVNDSLFSLDLHDGKLQTNLAARPEIGGKVAMQIAVEGVEGFSPSFLESPVEGLFELTGIDLGMVDAFSGYGIEPTGFLHTTMTLGGTVG